MSIDRCAGYLNSFESHSSHSFVLSSIFDPVEEKHSDFGLNYYATRAALFRYSAATFNAHRIHLDPEYCRNEEGHPGA